MTQTTREQHLQWCKTRALEYLDSGDVMNGITSMVSDLKKHPETAPAADHLMPLAMMYIAQNDHTGARRFIEGFR